MQYIISNGEAFSRSLVRIFEKNNRLKTIGKILCLYSVICVPILFSFVFIYFSLTEDYSVFSSGGTISSYQTFCIYLLLSGIICYSIALRRLYKNPHFAYPCKHYEDYSDPIPGVSYGQIKSEGYDRVSNIPTVKELQSTPIPVPAPSPVPAPNPTNHKNSRSRYCKFCGGKIDDSTKKCASCGKQYFRIKKMKKNSFFIVLLSILCASLLALNLIQFFSVPKSTSYKIDSLSKQVYELKTKIESKNAIITEYQQIIKDIDNSIPSDAKSFIFDYCIIKAEGLAKEKN